MYINFNANPAHRRTIDCTIRAISCATGESWETVFIGIVMECLRLHDMPEKDHVWGTYLYKNGWRRKLVDAECPSCYTLGDFCREYPDGIYIVAVPGHLAAVKGGDLYDTWDSSQECPIYYWEKGGE